VLEVCLGPLRELKVLVGLPGPRGEFLEITFQLRLVLGGAFGARWFLLLSLQRRRGRGRIGVFGVLDVGVRGRGRVLGRGLTLRRAYRVVIRRVVIGRGRGSGCVPDVMTTFRG